MSAEAAVLTRTWKVRGYTATLTMQRPAAGEIANAVIEWEPRVPRNLGRQDLETYRAGRDKAIAELSRLLGLRVAVVEV